MTLDVELLAEFADEVSELADAIETELSLALRAEAGGGAPSERPTALREIERCLHTIKGNTGALGFGQQSSDASDELARVRRLMSDERQRIAGHAAEQLRGYLTRTRRWLASDLCKAPRASVTPAPQVALDGSAPAAGAAPAANASAPAGEAWDREADALLATAPLQIQPDIASLASLARRRLEELLAAADREGPALLPIDDGLPLRKAATLVSPPRLVPAGERQRALADAPIRQPPWVGYAYEARAAADTGWALARALSDTHPALAHQAVRLAEVLDSFGNWSVDARREPLAPHFDELARGFGGRAQAAGRQLRVAFEAAGLLISPLVGRFVCAQLRTVLDAALRIERGWPESATVSIGASRRDDGGLRVELDGLPPARGSNEMWLQEPSWRLGKIGVELSSAVASDQLQLELPALHAVEVLLAWTGRAPVGIPWHRVLELRQQAVLADLQRDGQELALLDLRIGEQGAGDPGAEDVADLVVINGLAGPLAVAVDGLLRREEMLVEPRRDAPPGARVAGFCFGLDAHNRIPLLGPAVATRDDEEIS